VASGETRFPARPVVGALEDAIVSRRGGWTVATLGAVAIVLVGAVILFDWNWLKGPIESQVSGRLGRPFRIHGDLNVELSLKPRITVEGGELGNAPWGDDRPMAKIDRVEARVDLLKLLQGDIVLPEVRITRPDLLLETRPDGPPNWQFGDAKETSPGPPALPRIDRLEISDTSIRYHDVGSGRDVTANLTRIAGRTDPDLTLNATGKLRGQPLEVEFTGAALAQFENGAAPYPASLALKLGQSDLRGDVTLDLYKEVPAIRAKLASDRVVTADFTALLHSQQPPDATREKPSGAPGRAFEEALAKAGQTGGGSVFDPNRLPVLDGELQYAITELKGPELALRDLNLNASLHDRLPRLALSGRGQHKGKPVVLDVKAGAESRPGSNPVYTIDARVEAGETRIATAGAIGKPDQLQDVELRFELTSPDATELLRALGIDAPALPLLQAAGNLIRNDQAWQLNDAHAQVGESNLAGRLSVDFAKSRPFISADLESDRLRAQDLKVAPSTPAQPPGADESQKAASSEPASASESSAPLLSAAGLNFEALPKVDADVKFRGSNLEAPEVRLAQLELALKLRDRVAIIDATGEGTFRERQPVSFEAHAGTEDSLKNPESRYPVDVSLAAGESRVTAKGTVAHPLNYTGVDVDVALQGPDLGKLGELLKLPLPGTPPYKLAGKITHQEQEKRWNFVALRGTVGDSDMQGDVSLELGGERPTVIADLKSKTLDLDDLGVLVGAPPGTGPGETASEEQKQKAAQEAAAKAPVLPDKQFDVPELRAFDARIAFKGETVQAMKLPLEHMEAKVTLQDGHIKIDPARLDVAGGKLESRIGLNAPGGVLNGDLDLTLRNVKLNRLLAAFKVDVGAIQMEKEGVGTFGGQTKLTINGNSIRDMAAAADGELAVIMGGGQINSLIIEALGLDLGEVLAVLAAGDEEKEKGMVPVQCLVSRFDVQKGVMATKALVLETSDSTVTGSGTIDLGQETLDITLLAHPKDVSVLAASTPVTIKGTFRDPQIDVVSKQLEEKSLAALALGVVMPVIGAVLPFIETGEAKGVNCAALMTAAQTASDAPKAPPSEKQ
jgi:AsmA family protein